MKILFNSLLLIYALSLILSCSFEGESENDLAMQEDSLKKDSAVYTLEDTLIAHASVLKEKAEGVMFSKLIKMIRDRGNEKAVYFCSYKHNDSFYDLLKIHNVQMKRYGKKSIDSIQYPDICKLAKTFGSVGHSLTNVKHTDSLSKVYLGFKIKDASCLNCHGIPHQDILSNTWKSLLEKDLDFKEHGYLPNEFMGVWEIDFHKKIKNN